MTVLKSEECQRRGAVILVCTVGEFEDKRQGDGFMENTRLTLALPLHQAAIHVFMCQSECGQLDRDGG